MLYITIIVVLLIFVLLFRVYNRVKLPKNVASLIREINTENLPEFITGKTGFANNSDVKIAYEIIESETSNGKSIILVNGHGHSRLFWPTYFYQPFLDQGYKIIKYDNRGLGESDWMNNWSNDNPYSLEDMATDTIAVLDALKIEKAHFIGMSMGGMISQRIAISFPTRIASLTSIMSTGFYDDPELVTLPKKFYNNIVAVTLLYGRKLKSNPQKMMLSLATQRLLKGKGTYKIDDKEILQKAFYELTKRNGLNAKVSNQHTAAIRTSGSRYRELGKIRAPSLVIHGTDDPLIQIAHAKVYADLIPDVKTLFIKNMGHDLPKKYVSYLHKSIFKNININQLN